MIYYELRIFDYDEEKVATFTFDRAWNAGSFLDDYLAALDRKQRDETEALIELKRQGF